jgi:transposase InsO family protein
LKAEEKKELMRQIEAPGVNKSKMLKKLKIPGSTYYHWRALMETGGVMALEKAKPRARRIWNRMTEQEEAKVLEVAKAHPELSCRLIGVKITDTEGFYVSESKVYQILKAHGLISPRPLPEMPSAKEYWHKTERPNEMWQVDATQFFVVNWGFYKLIPVLDDYSRKIIAWSLEPDETADSISRAIQRAVEAAGVEKMKPEDRPVILSDNGSGFVSEILAGYLTSVGIRHIFGKPYHPQTQGKVERWNRRVKEGVCLLVYCSPTELEHSIAEFVERYDDTPHEGLKNVSPNDVYAGRKEEVLQKRQETKRLTLERRKRINLDSGQDSGVN